MNAKQVGKGTIGVDAQHAACTPRRSGAVPADGDMDAEEALEDLRARAWTSVGDAKRLAPARIWVGRTPASITSVAERTARRRLIGIARHHVNLEAGVGIEPA